MLENEIEFSSLIILWECYFCLGAEAPPLPAHTMTGVLTAGGGVSVLLGCPALLMSGDQSSSPAEGFEAQWALFRSSQGLLREGGNQVTAHGWRRAWREDKVKGCNNLHPKLGAVQQLPCCAWSPGEPLWANLTDFLPTPITAKLGLLLNTWILP